MISDCLFPSSPLPIFPLPLFLIFDKCRLIIEAVFVHNFSYQLKRRGGRGWREESKGEQRRVVAGPWRRAALLPSAFSRQSNEGSVVLRSVVPSGHHHVDLIRAATQTSAGFSNRGSFPLADPDIQCIRNHLHVRVGHNNYRPPFRASSTTGPFRHY